MAPASATYAALPRDTVQQQIDAQNNALEKVVEQYNATTIALHQAQNRQSQLQTQLQAQQSAVDAASSHLGKLATAMYESGPMNGLSGLLSSASPQAFLDQLTTLNQAARTRGKDLASYRQARATYQTDKATADQNVATQAAQQQKLAAQKTQIDSQLAQLKAKKASAGISLNSGPTSPPSNAPYYPGKAGIAVKFAYSQIGSQYNYAQAGPYSVGYDCSGLTMAAWAKAGISLPHNAAMQWSAVTHISRSQLQPGDLVFYNGLGHVGIFVGGGQIIHAPHTGTTVQLASINIDSLYGYGRP